MDERERAKAIHRERGIEVRARNALAKRAKEDGSISITDKDVQDYIRRHERMHDRLRDKGIGDD